MLKYLNEDIFVFEIFFILSILHFCSWCCFLFLVLDLNSFLRLDEDEDESFTFQYFG